MALIVQYTYLPNFTYCTSAVSINPLTLMLILYKDTGGLESIPANTGQEVKYTLMDLL